MATASSAAPVVGVPAKTRHVGRPSTTNAHVTRLVLVGRKVVTAKEAIACAANVRPIAPRLGLVGRTKSPDTKILCVGRRVVGLEAKGAAKAKMTSPLVSEAFDAASLLLVAMAMGYPLDPSTRLNDVSFASHRRSSRPVGLSASSRLVLYDTGRAYRRTTGLKLLASRPFS